MVSVGLNGKRRERKVDWMDGWMIDAGKCHFRFFRPAGPPSFHSTALASSSPSCNWQFDFFLSICVTYWLY